MKKLVSFVLSAMIVLGCISTSPAFAKDVIIGDVNGDGAVSLADVIAIYRHNFKYETLSSDTADINGDSRVNLLDAAVLMKHLTGGDTVIDTEYTDVPPAEYEDLHDGDKVNTGFFLEADPIFQSELYYEDKLTLKLYRRNSSLCDAFIYSLYVDYSDGLVLDSIEYNSENISSVCSDLSVSPVKIISANKSFYFPKDKQLVATLTFSVIRKDDIKVNVGIGEAINMDYERFTDEDFDFSGFTWEMGDLNCDGRLTLSDVSEALKHIAGWYCSCMGLSIYPVDFNGDGKLTLTDVSAMLKKIAGWSIVANS
ncbi:MAG: hypothetical protein E7578_02300 [Ruminococcaceae bacterium]|nr:hypothetical protein [Oscillospiraceae bacterium]